jgi:hypothetical protein
MAVWPLLLILLCNLLNVSWWLIATAFGYTVCMVANTSTARYAEFSINAARGMDLSAVPAKFKGIIGLDMYAKRGPSMLFLVAVVWAAAVPLYLGVVPYPRFYLIIVAINIVLFYLIKSS